MTRQEQIEAVKNAEMSPSEKRLALKNLGVATEYMPHNGQREIARRLKQAQRNAP